VKVDPGYQGPVTNTATISHPSLLTPVIVQAVAHITDQPVFLISKSASPDPVESGSELIYTLNVFNAGQQATGLVITDMIPSNTSYVPGSATSNGQLVGDQIRWVMPLLKPSENRALSFRVRVNSGEVVVNKQYGVTSAEGVGATGAQVVTSISGHKIYLPVLSKN